MKTKQAHAPTTKDAYAPIAAELEAAQAAMDPILAVAAVRRAQLELARIATSASFDASRSRAIGLALREVARITRTTSQVAPLAT